ncbi:MAG: recombination mediator RecR [Luteibaculum sp.]
MIEDQIPSKHVAKAVEQLSSLPSVGKKTALRLVLSMLKWEKDRVLEFGLAFSSLAENVNYCERCHNLSDEKICKICSNPSREEDTLCVVESVKDVLAIESTMQFKGVYHVLGGIIAPMEGIGPEDLNISSLEERCQKEPIKEVILALSATMEGDTTGFYLHKKLAPHCEKITTLARGIGFGDELEYADELSLGRSILYRTPYEQSQKK